MEKKFGYLFVELSTLVAVCLVEMSEKKGKGYVSWDKVMEYGHALKKELSKIAHSVILKVGEEAFEELVYRYDKYIGKHDDIFFMKPGVTADDIRKHILAFTPARTFLTMLDNNLLKVITE